MFKHLLPAALAVLAAPAAFAVQTTDAGQQAGTTSACACTCAACLAKHGPKAQPAATPEEAAAAAEREAAERVLEALRTELDAVDALVADAVVEAVVEVAEEPVPVDVESVEGEVVEVADGLEVVADEVEAAAARRPVRIELPTEEPRMTWGEGAPAANKGYLGVTIAEGDDGVSVGEVMDGSPAEAAGVRPGDVLFNVGGTSVLDTGGLRAALAARAAGDELTLGIMRDGKPMRVRLTLGDSSVLRAGARPEVEEEIIVLPEVAAEAPEVPRGRIRVESVPGGQGDELPEGYEEIIVRRERRPAAGRGGEAAALGRRIAALEAELEQLSAMLAEIQAELDRRNPR